MARKIDKITGPQRLRPQADYREVNTFVRPSPPSNLPSKPPQTNGAMRLATALNQFEPGLNKFLEASAIANDEERYAEGEAAAAKFEFDKNRMAWADLVEQNPELLTRDPWYRRGLRTAYLKQRAADYDLDMRAAYNEAGEVRNSDDSETFQKWQNDFRLSWIEENIGDVEEGELVDAFIPGMQQSEKNLQNHHANIREQELRKMGPQSVQNSIAKELEVVMGTLEGNDPTLTPQRTIDLAAKVQGILDDAINSHMNKSEVNAVAVKAIGSLADYYEDEEILSVMDYIETSKGNFLGGTAQAKAVKNEVAERLQEQEFREDEREYRRQERHDKDQAEKIRGHVGQKMVQAVLKGEDFNVLEELAVLGNSGYSSSVMDQVQGNLITTWKAMQTMEEEAKYDDKAWTQLRARVYEGEEVAGDVLRMTSAGIIKPTWANQIFDDMDRMRSYRTRLEDDIFKRGSKYLENRLAPSSLRTTSPMDYGEAERVAQEAILRFRSDVVSKMEAYEEKHGVPMPDDEVRKMAEDLFVSIGNMEHYHTEGLKTARGDGGVNNSVAPVRTPEETKIRGEYEQAVPLQEALSKDPAEIDPESQYLWPTTDSFMADVEQWEQGKEDGPVALLADHLGFENPADLIRLQTKRFGGGDYLSPEEMAEKQRKEAEQRRAEEERSRQEELEEQRQQDIEWLQQQMSEDLTDAAKQKEFKERLQRVLEQREAARSLNISNNNKG